MASAVLLFKGAAKVRRVMRSLQRQEVAALGAELQEIALPVAEFLTPINDLWSLMDGAAAGDRFAPALEVAPSACRLGPHQDAVELLLADFWAVDEAVDRLVADL